MVSSKYTFFGDHIVLETSIQAGDRLVESDRQVVMQWLLAVAEGIWHKSIAPAKGRGGRKPLSSEVVLLLKRLYNLSDVQTEHQLRDRLSFLLFLRLGLGDEVLDSRILWLYVELLSRAGGARQLVDALNKQLLVQGFMLNEGIMVDAIMVETPRRRKTHKENALLKQGETPTEWKKHPRKLAKRRKAIIRARVDHPFCLHGTVVGRYIQRVYRFDQKHRQIGRLTLCYNFCPARYCFVPQRSLLRPDGNHPTTTIKRQNDQNLPPC